MTKLEAQRAYLKADSEFDKAKKEREKAKEDLKKLYGIETSKLTEEEAKEVVEQKFDEEYVKMSFFPKSKMSYDSKTMEKLCEKYPEIDDAKRYSYWTEFKVVPKSREVK